MPDSIDATSLAEYARKLILMLPRERRLTILRGPAEQQAREVQRTLEQLHRAIDSQLDMIHELGLAAYFELAGRKRCRRGALPDGAAAFLTLDNPQIDQLRAHYADHPAARLTKWTRQNLEHTLALAHFRADGPFLWQNRAGVTDAHYLLAARHVQAIDQLGLLGLLREDGDFGAYSVELDDTINVSRDLLDSIVEISFLERHLELSKQSSLRVLDVGAGYGRLAHRMARALSNLERYYCVDAVPESTFVCRYYIEYRGLTDKVSVVPLHEVEALTDGAQIDLAVNIHSFSECPLSAINWWLSFIQSLGPTFLLIVPNEARLLSTENDGSRLDYSDLLAERGYELAVREPYWNAPRPLQRELTMLSGGEFYLFRNVSDAERE